MEAARRATVEAAHPAASATVEAAHPAAAAAASATAGLGKVGQGQGQPCGEYKRMGDCAAVHDGGLPAVGSGADGIQVACRRPPHMEAGRRRIIPR